VNLLSTRRGSAAPTNGRVSPTGKLAGDLYQLPWPYLFDGRTDTRHQRAEIKHAISHAENEHYANSNGWQVLLIPESFVGSDNDLEAEIDCSP